MDRSSTHPVLSCLATMDGSLKDVADVEPVFMTVADKRAALLELDRLAARVTELQLRVLGASDDVAAEEGMRNVAAWLAHHARVDPGEARRRLRLARDLARMPAATAALRDGVADVAQVTVITHAVDELPDEVDPETRARAEAHLVAQAQDFAPGQLRTLGRRVLDVIAPDVAEDHERRLLENQEAAAYRRTSLRTRVNGDGTTDLHVRVPDHAATRLMGYLEAYTSPRVDGTNKPAGSGDPGDPGDRRPYSERLGHAFVSFLEHTDPTRMPLHGGDATTIIITIDHDTLTHDLAGTGLIADQPATPGHVRRLACTAGIIPAVLDGDSHVLDLGRTKRLFNPHQRKALALRDVTCRGEGCDIPAPWCEAHHLTPWTKGGHTNLDDGVLLCSHHHHRIHDHRYHHTRQPDGRIRFHRRTQIAGPRHERDPGAT